MNTIEEKLVSEYTGLNLERVEELEAFTFWLYLRDAVVYNCSRTEAGREYLEKCWTLEQTAPDRAAIRRKAKGG